MKLYYLIFAFALIYAEVGYCQEWEATFIDFLDQEVSESSGLIVLGDYGITHNDSGNDPYLYELDLNSGDVLRRIYVRNAVNKDWEDICKDESFIYIGDFGNNAGNRSDLHLLKISIDSFLHNDTVVAQKLSFEYKDQINFEPSTFETNYDAEALFSSGDSLYILTKQWGNFKTRVYALPKVPGNYSLVAMDSLNTNFMVTGADASSSFGHVGLVGYSFTQAFFISLPLSNLGNWHAISFTRNLLETSGSMQVESFGFDLLGQGYFSSENNPFGKASLYRLVSTSTCTSAESLSKLSFYPNPSSTEIHFFDDELFTGVILSRSGEVVNRFFSKSVVDVSYLVSGPYIIVLYGEGGDILSRKLFIKQ